VGTCQGISKITQTRTDLDLCVFLLLYLFRAYSCHQLSDAAEGLRYLHSCNVIHGDLKGVGNSISLFATILMPDQVNILVDSSGLVCLADFGLATVTQNPNSMQNVSRPGGFTPGWTAPEILEAKETCSKKADIFSLAMVMIEVRH